jgi:hypothetical protein
MPENRQKIKLLLLWNLLLDQSDEQHPLTTKEILQMLQDQNVDCERRTLSKDIDLLNEEGFEVLSAFIGSTKAYYVEDRQFSVPELQILIDAIKAAQFITPKKTKNLLQKSLHWQVCTARNPYKTVCIFLHSPKHSNEIIYYAIDALNKAIYEKSRPPFSTLTWIRIKSGSIANTKNTISSVRLP